MDGQKGSWTVSHLEISRPISFESGARLLTAVAGVSFSLYRRTWDVNRFNRFPWDQVFPN